MDKLQKLRLQLAKAHVQIDKIEDEKRLKAGRKLVGKCFKYRNCFSCPSSDADYWWLYCRVLGLTKNGHPEGIHFQVDRDGRASMEPFVSMSAGRADSGYLEITAAEYADAMSAFMKSVETLASKKSRRA